jgi:hypothetical protein
MGAYPAAVAPHEDIDKEAGAVHEWRVSRLMRLGLARPVAEAVADQVDWHDVARLVRRGCPVSLAVAIVELGEPEACGSARGWTAPVRWRAGAGFVASGGPLR